jgi:hypothetical protein
MAQTAVYGILIELGIVLWSVVASAFYVFERCGYAHHEIFAVYARISISHLATRSVQSPSVDALQHQR